MPLFGSNPEQDALVQSQEHHEPAPPSEDESLNVAFALLLIGLVLGLIIGATINAFLT